MIFIVYKTTNLINGKFYVGKHKQESDIFDGYLGSGSVLKRAIKKYRKGNFQRETIQTFDTEEEAYRYEKRIVANYRHLTECYNIRPGGTGRTYNTTESIRQLQSQSAKKRWQNDPEIMKIHQNMFKGSNGVKIRNKIKNTVSDLWKNKDYRDQQNKTRSKVEYKNKLSDAAMNETPKTCIHCGKSMRASHLSRWHGDNCKLNPDSVLLL